MSFLSKYNGNSTYSKIGYNKGLTFKGEINNFILIKSYKFNTSLEAFFEGKSQLLEHFKSFLKNYLNLDTCEYQIFNSDDVNFVKFLHNIFVIVPVNKAAYNYVIICKKKNY